MSVWFARKEGSSIQCIKQMSRFIKLSNMILNTAYIQKIDVQKTQYVLHMAMFPTKLLVSVFGTSGGYTEKICITNENNSDYRTIKQYMHPYLVAKKPIRRRCKPLVPRRCAPRRQGEEQ